MLLAAALFVLLAVAYSFSVDLRASRGALISSDEPFYLLTRQSLPQDGGLDLTKQYEADSWRSFFDHPDGRWNRSEPLPDGKLISPDNPGLPVLLVPEFAPGGLAGAQLQFFLLRPQQ